MTFQERVLYDVVDVTSLLRKGANAIGVMLAHGWFSFHGIDAGIRQFRLLLSVTTTSGTTYYPSVNANSKFSAQVLTFTATRGPIVFDEIEKGEYFDGRVARAIRGWNTINYSPPKALWADAINPLSSPADFGAKLAAHHQLITTDRQYSANITQPVPGQWIFDFRQNMAAQVTLTVDNCPAGTNISLYHTEILFSNGLAHDR